MRSTSLLALLASLTSVAWSQGTLPPCAQHCYITNVAAGGCGAADAKCICSNSVLIAKLSCCVKQSCDAADTASTEEFSQKLCAVFGVTNLPTSAACQAETGAASATAHLTRPTQNPGPIIHTSLNAKQSSILASIDSQLTKPSTMAMSMPMTGATMTGTTGASTTPAQSAGSASASASATTGGAAAITAAPVAGVGLAGALALGAFAFM